MLSSQIFIVSFSFIGLGLMFAPFVGLALDLQKNRKFTEFLGFLGLFLLAAVILIMMPTITTATIYALLLAPIVFIYFFILKIFRRKTDEKSSENKPDVSE